MLKPMMATRLGPSRDGAESVRLSNRHELIIARSVRGMDDEDLLRLLANTLGRCIPKMDHHCPWTVNCVSHRTFPHFFRFLLYSVVTMIYLAYFMYIRLATIWGGRNRPSVRPTLVLC